MWKEILFSLGLFSLVAVLLRSDSNVFLSPFLFVLNMLSVVFFRLFSMAVSFVLIGSILALLPFSALTYMLLFLKSMSIHLAVDISPILAPVSFRSWSSVAVFAEPADISVSISFSVGMNGIRDSFVYFGFIHFFPINSTYPL